MSYAASCRNETRSHHVFDAGCGVVHCGRPLSGASAVNTTLISAAIAAAMGFGSAWQIQNWRNLDAENHRLTLAREQEREIHAMESKRSAQIIAAQNDARKREGQLRADAATAVTAADKLRRALDSDVQAARADPTVCADTAATQAIILTDSIEKYRELAEICDRHVSDLKTLMESQ